MKGTAMKIDFQTLFRCVIAIVILAVVLILLQMWFKPFGIIVFWKILATLALLGGLVSFFIAVKQDITDEKKMRDDKYIE
jgi:hypothetical protein